MVSPLLGRQLTPFYLFSLAPIQKALAELDARLDRLPARYWLSCKTQPLPPLLRWWRQQGRPIEVVSEFELQAALREGFPPEQILVNGPAKHHWLPRHAVRRLQVNLDSLSEIPVVAPAARGLDWTLGLRINTSEEFDPETPACPTQFGLTADEVVKAIKQLERFRVYPKIAHLHLRTNVATAAIYQQALTEMASVCCRAGFRPAVVDCGGGFPPPHVVGGDGKRTDANFRWRELAGVYQQALRLFPEARELWLENGRWLSARSGVLVVKILDVKERRGMRHLICDGGRVLNALVSQWEAHELVPALPCSGAKTVSTVNGPTCMAFDKLARRPMPRRLRVGDHLIWLEAGAYHLPWETRFSHGLAAVFWHDEWGLREVRPRETFEAWWRHWG